MHCPTGAMWSRHGGRLSIAGEFSMALGEGTIPEDSVLLAPSIADTNGQALQLYRSLEAINRSVLADVFEGVVMKRAVSTYPVQLRSPDEKCRFWQKHRYLV